MKKFLNLGILVIIMGLILGGCGAPSVVENIDNSQYFTKSVAKVKIAKAIQRGASRKGWRTKAISNGLIEANINVRGKYFVAVNINYNSKGYKISYKKTRNLKYNKADNTIHPSYNKWVKILAQNIDYELENIGMNSATSTNTMAMDKPKKAKKVTTKSKTTTYKKGKNVNLQGKTIYIKTMIPYAPHSRVQANIRQECTLPDALSKDIAKYAAEQGLTVIAKNHIKANEYELQVQIENAVSAGNAAIGHNKFVAISGAIVKGNTKYYSFDAARLSGGGYFGAYRSSCSVLGGIARRLGKDTALWLSNPYDGAELGDTQLIRK